MQQTPQLLLVDGDPVLCQTLSGYLQGQGFGVAVKHDGETGLQQAAEFDYDIVILGDMLPGLCGSEVLRRIRQQGELPVVMLCARHDIIEYVLNLELGADDCLNKSCNLRELAARLRTILRRAQRYGRSSERMPGKDTASLSLSPAERTVTWRGKPLELTSTEFNLLEILFNNSGRIVSKAELAVNTLGREAGQFGRSLDMHISNLRKKLGKLADGRSPIQTVSRAGYQLLRR